MMHRRPFTLLELVVVIAIAALAIGMGASALKRRSGPAQFSEAVRGFQAFCVASRSQAMELGRDRVVYFLPQERLFRSGDPEVLPAPKEEEMVVLTQIPDEYRTDGDGATDDYDTPAVLTEPKWKLPEDYLLDEEASEGIEPVDPGGEEIKLEVFRFFADGGAAGRLKFTMQYRSWAKTFVISPLTGRILVEDTEVLR